MAATQFPLISSPRGSPHTHARLRAQKKFTGWKCWKLIDFVGKCISFFAYLHSYWQTGPKCKNNLMTAIVAHLFTCFLCECLILLPCTDLPLKSETIRNQLLALHATRKAQLRKRTSLLKNIPSWHRFARLHLGSTHRPGCYVTIGHRGPPLCLIRYTRKLQNSTSLNRIKVHHVKSVGERTNEMFMNKSTTIFKRHGAPYTSTVGSLVPNV